MKVGNYVQEKDKPQAKPGRLVAITDNGGGNFTIRIHHDDGRLQDETGTAEELTERFKVVAPPEDGW